jgi:hypothetical protein
MESRSKDRDIQEGRVAKALATVTVAEIRQLVREMDAELRKPILELAK